MTLIENEKEAGKSYINKLAAAERQLAAAIQMYFLCLDPVAIHTVSSAAHTILANLLEHRGKDASIHGVVYGFLRAARDLNEGKITEDEIREWGDGALGSGLIPYNQKMTMAAMAMADMKTSAHLS